MTVVIVPYDQRWQTEFAAIGAALRGALGELALREDWAAAIGWQLGPSDA